jgi:hypothetical protein
LIADCFAEWTSPHGDRIYGRIISVTQAGDVAKRAARLRQRVRDFGSYSQVLG